MCNKIQKFIRNRKHKRHYTRKFKKYSINYLN